MGCPGMGWSRTGNSSDSNVIKIGTSDGSSRRRCLARQRGERSDEPQTIGNAHQRGSHCSGSHLHTASCLVRHLHREQPGNEI